MSHIVTIKTAVRNALALVAACRRLGLAEPAIGTATLYSGQASGLIVQLPGWTYPVVFNTATGQIQFDNFNGCWGDQKQTGSPAAALCRGKDTDRGPQKGPAGAGAGAGRWLHQAHHHGRRCSMKTIEIIIDPQGNLKLQTRGYAGAECRAASSELEKALGQVTADQPTSELYRSQNMVDQHEAQRQ